MNLKLLVFCLLFPLFLLLLSYQLSLLFTSLTPEQENTLHYLQGKVPAKELRSEELRLNYTASEISHLQDVQNVMDWVDVAFIALFLAVAVLVINSKTEWRKLMRWGGIITVALVVFILIFLLLSFNTTFTLFHLLFFPQGNWLFPEGSLLIQTFPLDFFVKIATTIFLLTLFLGSLFILLPSFFRYDRRRPGF